MPFPLVVQPPDIEELPCACLDDVARPIAALYGAQNGDRELTERWLLQGITWEPRDYSPLFTADVDACNTIPAGLMTDFPRGCLAQRTQTAFSIYDAFRGSRLEYMPDDIEALLDGRLTWKVWAAMASELITGAASGDKALSKDAKALTLNGIPLGTVVPLYRALPMLENELATKLRGARGIIHMPPGMLSQAVFQGEVELDDQGRYVTPLGNFVVADAGYVNMPKPTSSATPSVAGTSDWVYASGMVHYAIAERQTVDGGDISMFEGYTGKENPLTADPMQHTMVTSDRITRFRNTYGIWQFDDVPVYAALVTYSENS